MELWVSHFFNHNCNPFCSHNFSLPLTVTKFLLLEFCSGKESVPIPISPRPNCVLKRHSGIGRKVTPFPTEIWNANKSNIIFTYITYQPPVCLAASDLLCRPWSVLQSPVCRATPVCRTDKGPSCIHMNLSCIHLSVLQSPHWHAATTLSCSHHSVLQPPLCHGATNLSCSYEFVMHPPVCHAPTSLWCTYHSAMQPPFCHAATSLSCIHLFVMQPPLCHAATAQSCCHRSAMQLRVCQASTCLSWCNKTYMNILFVIWFLSFT